MSEQEIKEAIAAILPDWVSGRDRIVELIYGFYVLFATLNAAQPFLAANTVIPDEDEDGENQSKTEKPSNKGK